MRISIRRGAIAIGAAAAFTGGAASVQAATICFAFQDLETEFWVAGHQAITSTLEERGHTVIERNANEDANRQLEQVRDCIAQGVDGIIIIPQDGESAVTIVGEAQDNDVPIAVFNRPGSALAALAGPTATALAASRIPERAAASLAVSPPPAWVFLSRPHIPISSTEIRRARR